MVELEKSLEGNTEGNLVCGHSDMSKFLGSSELTQFPISESTWHASTRSIVDRLPVWPKDTRSHGALSLQALTEPGRQPLLAITCLRLLGLFTSSMLI